MRDEIAEILRLQRQYSALPTPAMQRRGLLVRRLLPAALMRGRARLVRALGAHGEDLRAEGRDGLGSKARLPWTRFHSRARSPSARQGWYCVYLFDAAGEAAYLSLAHGSTFYEDGAFRPRPAAMMARLVAAGRAVLAADLAAEPGLTLPFDLGGGALGRSYEGAAVAARRYPAAALPSDAGFLEDAGRFAALLGRIHAAEDAGAMPPAPPPERIEVENAAAGRPGRGLGGQGGGLPPRARAAVVAHGLAVARAHLEALGWTVRPAPRGQPLDLVARRRGARLHVLVRASTATAAPVPLGRAELMALAERQPETALLLVRGVRLDETGEEVLAQGGEVRLLAPFDPGTERLRPLVSEYAPPDPG